jgi:hypothetical protein
MASMNKGLNLPAIQKIMNDFEKESSMMDMKEEMMSDAVDDVMEDDGEDEEEEGDKILREVLDEIGVSLSQQVSLASSLSHVYSHSSFPAHGCTYWFGFSVITTHGTQTGGTGRVNWRKWPSKR